MSLLTAHTGPAPYVVDQGFTLRTSKADDWLLGKHTALLPAKTVMSK